MYEFRRKEVTARMVPNPPDDAERGSRPGSNFTAPIPTITPPNGRSSAEYPERAMLAADPPRADNGMTPDAPAPLPVRPAGWLAPAGLEPVPGSTAAPEASAAQTPWGEPAPAVVGTAPMPIFTRPSAAPEPYPHLVYEPAPPPPPVAAPAPPVPLEAAPPAPAVTVTRTTTSNTTPAGALILLPNEEVNMQLGALYLTNKRAILYAPTILRAAFLEDVDAVGTVTERSGGWMLILGLLGLALGVIAAYIGLSQPGGELALGEIYRASPLIVAAPLLILGILALASYFFWVKRSLFLSVGGRPLIVVSLSGWSAKRLETVDSFVNAFSHAKDAARRS